MRGWGKSGVRRRLLRAVGAAPSSAARWPPAGCAVGPSTPRRPSPRPARARGVSADAINVVFPIISFSSIEGEFEIESDAEYGEQTKAIHLFVNQINQAGGIDGRKINPMIVSFDPTNPTNSGRCASSGPRATRRCSPCSTGSARGRGQRALRHPKGHTPMLSQWSTTTNWTDLGSPYLWWTGADDAPIWRPPSTGGSARAVSDMARRSASWSRTRSATRTRSTPTCCRT